MQENWLSLTEYSGKHGVSMSTLRRRIKSRQIPFRLDDGKYFLLDSQAKVAVQEMPIVHEKIAEKPALQEEVLKIEKNVGPTEETVLTAASKLLNELKRAYTSILQEKEEQLIQLKEEVSDLKTLVKVLESENARLRGDSPESLIDD